MFQFYLTCEHGGNEIPQEYQVFFTGADETLKTHKGWDIGVLPVAQRLASDLGLPFVFSKTSRLLVELNRSLDNPQLFSDYTKQLSEPIKKEILTTHYFPYRNQVESDIRKLINDGNKIIHISVHSFTPTYEGKVREGDIGLLFDQERELERKVCNHWSSELSVADETLNAKDNYPYLGTDDGFTTYLRTKFTEETYAGIEIEINQKLLMTGEDLNKIYLTIYSSIKALITQFSKF